MKGFRRILVALKDPDARHQPGAEKALRIAKQLGASVEFFHAISAPVLLDVQPLTGHSVAQLRREALELRQKRLDSIVELAHRLGVKATGAVEWDFPPHEAIVRRAIRVRADLVIAECHRGSRRLAPWLIHLTDWELLRASPVPVLLLKNGRPWRKRTVLAAVDPTHAHAKPSRLDAQILAEGRQLARKIGGSLHVMHANFPALSGFTAGDPSIDAVTLEETYHELKEKGRKAFTAFATRARIPPARRHLVDGDPLTAIPRAARKTAADLVVMGAVSRSGLKRIFIGNTAERVLNDLPCDVLVVKPAHFEKRVPSKVRGMRVVPPQPIFPLPV
jgi:universal stress protein E